MNNKAIRKYLRQVRRIYHGNRKIKRQFIQDLEDSLFYYSERHLNCTYSDLVRKFGTPDEVQESFSEIIPDKIKKRNLRLYYFVILSCSFLTIMLVAFTIYHAIDIVNIGLHFFHKDVRPYDAFCSEA